MEWAEIFDATWRAFIGRFFLNLIFVFIVSRFFFYANGKGSREYLFTFISTSVIIFVICILISNVKVELGLALGLFAVFSVIRFRSVQATARELSFLFVCLGSSLIYALMPLETPLVKLLINSILILVTIGMADHLIFRNKPVVKVINYDRLELLAEGKRTELETDLKTRFGLTDIVKIQEGDIDTLKGRIRLKIQIRDPEGKHFQER